MTQAGIRRTLSARRKSALMVDDPDWTAASEVADTARLVIDYVRTGYGLIPDCVPTAGRLDDAIVLETAWPRLAAEIEGYLDFCRVRQFEAGQGSPAARGFSRAAWQQVRREAFALAAHQRSVRERSYFPAPAVLFQIH